MKRSTNSLNQHWTQHHGKMVPKVAYKSLDDAVSIINTLYKNKPHYHPYICSFCGQWHIGHHKSKK